MRKSPSMHNPSTVPRCSAALAHDDDDGGTRRRETKLTLTDGMLLLLRVQLASFPLGKKHFIDLLRRRRCSALLLSCQSKRQGYKTAMEPGTRTAEPWNTWAPSREPHMQHDADGIYKFCMIHIQYMQKPIYRNPCYG